LIEELIVRPEKLTDDLRVMTSSIKTETVA